MIYMKCQDFILFKIKVKLFSACSCHWRFKDLYFSEKKAHYQEHEFRSGKLGICIDSIKGIFLEKFILAQDLNIFRRYTDSTCT